MFPILNYLSCEKPEKTTCEKTDYTQHIHGVWKSLKISPQCKILLSIFGAKIQINSRLDNGWTTIKCACQSGHKDVVQLFLNHSDRNIDMKAKNKDGKTPVMLACQKGHQDVVQLLAMFKNETLQLFSNTAYCIFQICVTFQPKKYEF